MTSDNLYQNKKAYLLLTQQHINNEKHGSYLKIFFQLISSKKVAEARQCELLHLIFEVMLWKYGFTFILQLTNLLFSFASNQRYPRFVGF